MAVVDEKDEATEVALKREIPPDISVVPLRKLPNVSAREALRTWLSRNGDDDKGEQVVEPFEARAYLPPEVLVDRRAASEQLREQLVLEEKFSLSVPTDGGKARVFHDSSSLIYPRFLFLYLLSNFLRQRFHSPKMMMIPSRALSHLLQSPWMTSTRMYLKWRNRTPFLATSVAPSRLVSIDPRPAQCFTWITCSSEPCALCSVEEPNGSNPWKIKALRPRPSFQP